MQKEEVTKLLTEAENHLTNELLPFWITRMIDSANGVQPATCNQFLQHN